MKPDWPAYPPRPFNPPGRDAIDYRVTSHGASFQRMLARLSPYMAGLSSRNRDDPTVALVDACAMVTDVLTFYQERIANEGYLRTATERLSIVELARHVYELDHGVSAATHIAFTVDDDAGEIEIPAGTRIMSMPVPGTAPETFETTETITGRAGWNEIPLVPVGPAPARRSPSFAANATQLRVEGVVPGLAPGSWILVKAADSSNFRVLQVNSVSRDPAGEWTAIQWARSEPGGTVTGDIDNPEIYWLRQELGLLGYNLAALGKGDVASRLASIEQAVNDDRAEDAWNHARALAELSAGRFPSLQDPMSALLVAVHGFRQDKGKKEQARDAVAAMSSRQDAYTELPHFRVHDDPDGGSGDRSIDLAVEARDLFADTWLVFFDIGRHHREPALRKAAQITPSAQQARFGLLSRTTRIVLDEPVERDRDLRDTLVLADPEPLAQWRDPRAPLPVAALDEPVAEPLQGPRQLTSSALPGDAAETLPGRMIAILGRVAGQPAAEIATVVGVSSDGVITLDGPLRHIFDAGSIVGNANLAPASHGDTVEQPLGGGDSTRVGQRFTLFRSPLSFMPSPRGPVPHLTVRVGGVEWQRVDSLDEVDGTFPGYMARIRDDGTATVVFGDGVNGARLPSGVDNVVATYRVGMGTAGNLPAGRLTVLPDPPPGVAAAVNPVPARGGRDPDTIEQARKRAEFATRVSSGPITRSELEDMVWASGEVSKVALRLLATPGVPQLVQFTVAGKDWSTGVRGAVSDELCAALERELSRIAPNPGRRYRVQSYAVHEVSIVIATASFAVDSGAFVADVRERATAALQQHFGLARSEFGQVLPKSRVEAVLRDIPGLQAFDLIVRDRHGATVDAVVARGAHIRPDGTVAPAELLAPAVTWSEGNRS